jgi:hypothetical protein
VPSKKGIRPKLGPTAEAKELRQQPHVAVRRPNESAQAAPHVAGGAGGPLPSKDTPHEAETLATNAGRLPESPKMDQPMAFMHDLPFPWLSAEPSLEQNASMIRPYEGAPAVGCRRT